MAELKPTTDLSNMITGLFPDRRNAELAYENLLQSGYKESDISLIMSEATKRHLLDEVSQEPALAHGLAQDADQKERARKLGGPMGGTLGIFAPILAAGAVLLIPGFVVAGPVAAALAAAGAVGLAGGLVSALTNWGVSDQRTREYEAGLRRGGILIGVKPTSDEQAGDITRQWQALGAEHVHR